MVSSKLPQGETPYDSLPANGIDQLSTSARGYTARRYTGENYLYFEAEYRRNIYKWFGMTGFANVHSVTEQETDEFLYYNPGGGVGFRFKFSKQARTAISLDFGWGKQGSSGMYLRLIDAFLEVFNITKDIFDTYKLSKVRLQIACKECSWLLPYLRAIYFYLQLQSLKLHPKLLNPLWSYRDTYMS